MGQSHKQEITDGLCACGNALQLRRRLPMLFVRLAHKKGVSLALAKRVTRERLVERETRVPLVRTHLQPIISSAQEMFSCQIFRVPAPEFQRQIQDLSNCDITLNLSPVPCRNLFSTNCLGWQWIGMRIVEWHCAKAFQSCWVALWQAIVMSSQGGQFIHVFCLSLCLALPPTTLAQKALLATSAHHAHTHTCVGDNCSLFVEQTSVGYTSSGHLICAVLVIGDCHLKYHK